MEHRITTVCALVLMLITASASADECSDFRAALKVKEAISDTLSAHIRDGGSVNDAVYQTILAEYGNAAEEYYLAHQNLRNSIDDFRDKKLSELFDSANTAMQQAVTTLEKWNRKRSEALLDIALAAVESADKADAAVQLAIGCQSEDE